MDDGWIGYRCQIRMTTNWEENRLYTKDKHLWGFEPWAKRGDNGIPIHWGIPMFFLVTIMGSFLITDGWASPASSLTGQIIHGAQECFTSHHGLELLRIWGLRWDIHFHYPMPIWSWSSYPPDVILYRKLKVHFNLSWQATSFTDK